MPLDQRRSTPPTIAVSDIGDQLTARRHIHEPSKYSRPMAPSKASVVSPAPITKGISSALFLHPAESHPSTMFSSFPTALLEPAAPKAASSGSTVA